jgi:alpha-maltose-1-phosphate synthase
LNLLLAHPGTQYAFRLAVELYRRDALFAFHTGLAFGAGGWGELLWKALPNSFRRSLVHRRIQGLPADKLHVRPFGELIALLQLRRGGDSQQIIHLRNESFQRAIPDEAINYSDALIGFDTSSWILSGRCAMAGVPFILDQSIGHPCSFKRVTEELSVRFPAWAGTIPHKSAPRFALEAKEHAEACRIVVPSRFVARTLQEHGVGVAKMRINPFGVDLDCFRPSTFPPALKPMRFAFAGSLQPRKGLPLLLNAWMKLPINHGAELWIAGRGEIPTSVRRNVPSSVRFLGGLPQVELAQFFRQCHVFVFPSFFEGLAQVQIEAAVCGLPVIGTESSGCEEIVRHGETGYILPTGNGDALLASLRKFISTPELVLCMRGRLLAERSQWSWDCYGDRWMKLLGDIFEPARTVPNQI